MTIPSFPMSPRIPPRERAIEVDAREWIADMMLAVATVEITRHLFAFFPDLEGKELRVEAATVAEVVRAMDELAPGLAFYICDERGRLRRHVNIFVDEQMVSDRGRLSDRVGPSSRVLIMQALSGG